MLVLDANILIRAVLGRRVLSLLRANAKHADFCAPESAFQEAREKLPEIMKRRGLALDPILAVLDQIGALVEIVDVETYFPLATAARQRLVRRDPDDWPILAAALALRCAIWTEDRDFFGCGVATWTTDRIEIYLAESAAE